MGIVLVLPPSMNFLRPPNTQFLQFFTEHVTWRCDLDLWPLDLGVMLRDATLVAYTLTIFKECFQFPEWKQQYHFSFKACFLANNRTEKWPWDGWTSTGLRLCAAQTIVDWTDTSTRRVPASSSHLPPTSRNWFAPADCNRVSTEKANK